MNAKMRVLRYANGQRDAWTTSAAANALGLNVSTIRKAVAKLVQEGELVRHEDNTINKATVSREHNGPTIKEILQPKFEDALGSIPVVIPEDIDPDTKREMKRAIRDALSAVTYGNTVMEVTSQKGFSKYNESHLNWYKSQFLREKRAELTSQSTTEHDVEMTA